MNRFSTYLVEGAAGKNLHMEHIEDEILNFGVAGGRASINFLQSLRDMMAGQAEKRVNITVKWDGAPAVFAGVDPEDGKFFVGTKGVFNKVPKLVKAPGDEKQFSAGLQDKLLIAYNTLKDVGIPEGTVLQGDMMFTKSDLGTDTIGGEDFLTFQPNTIVYAVPTGSDLAKTIRAARMGIVWHTTYSGGETLQDMKASFGANISKLKRSKNVWMDDASYKDVSGSMIFTEKETAEITRHLSRAGTVFQKIKSRDLNDLLRIQQTLEGSSAAGSSFKTYNNTLVRAGESVKNPRGHSRGYASYFKTWWEEKMIGRVKQESTKKQKAAMMNEYLRVINKTEPTLRQVVEFQMHLLAAKAILIKKLDTGANRMTRTFIRTATGFKVTPDEGYVAIDRMKGNAVKLVDRLEFSHNNFTATKNWSK